MSKISITGASTGSATFTIESPATSTNRTLTLPDNTGTIITQNSTPAFASTIGVGGATAAASGAGITFPATVSASSDANTLDDYEEGTWTPILTTDGTNFTSVSYSTQTGSYTKIGNICYVRGTLTTSAVTIGGATTNVVISGLPFTVLGDDSTINCNYASSWAGEEPLNGLTNNNSTRFYLYYRATVDGGSITTKPSDVGTGAGSNVLYFSGVFTVA